MSTTTTEPTESAAVPGRTHPPTAGTDHVAVVIDAGRARIDELDDQIVGLIRQRLQVSRAIQRARITGGGRRVEHSREIEVMNRYAAALGHPGATLALTVLELSRGASGAGPATDR